jgi:hypothetical protein
MSVVRNLLTVMGVVLVFGIVYFFIRPDAYSKMYSSTFNPNEGEKKSLLSVSSATVRVNYSPKSDTLELEKGDAGNLPLIEVMEGPGLGFPSKNVPYLLLINKETNQMRYWKLSKNVTKITLRNPPSLSVKVIDRQPSNFVPAYQMEVWSNSTELSFEVELAAAK